MALQTLPSDPSPDVNISSEHKPNIKVAQFGDGYSQRVGFGINSIKIEVQLVWTNINTTEKDTIINFIEDHSKGEAFEYTLPDEGTARKWYVKEWSKTYVKYGVYRVSASLEEVFDI